MTWRIPLAAALAATLVAGAVALAQPAVRQPSPPPPAVQQPSPPPPPPVSVPPPPSGASVDEAVNLRVEVVISRYRGGEQVSRLPYVLSFTPARGVQSSLSLDAHVPLRESTRSHRSVGTRIGAFARGVGDGRYAVTVDIEESSVLDDGETSMEAIMLPGRAVFGSFTSHNTLVLRNGQSHSYAAAIDRVTGETVRVDVTLTVLDQESAP